jgi:hypothetical protein
MKDCPPTVNSLWKMVVVWVLFSLISCKKFINQINKAADETKLLSMN